MNAAEDAARTAKAARILDVIVTLAEPMGADVHDLGTVVDSLPDAAISQAAEFARIRPPSWRTIAEVRQQARLRSAVAGRFADLDPFEEIDKAYARKRLEVVG